MVKIHYLAIASRTLGGVLSLGCQPAVLQGEQARALGYRSVDVAVFPPGEMKMGWIDVEGRPLEVSHGAPWAFPHASPTRTVHIRHPLAVEVREHGFPPRGERLWATSVCEVAQVANELSRRDGLRQCYVVDPPSPPVGSWEGPHCESRVTLVRPCNGYRVPTMDEWEYAARISRGADLWGTPTDNLLAQEDPKCGDYRSCMDSTSRPHCIAPELWMEQGRDTPGVLENIFGNRAEMTWSDTMGHSPEFLQCTENDEIAFVAGGMFFSLRKDIFVAGREPAPVCDNNYIGVRLVAGGNFLDE